MISIKGGGFLSTEAYNCRIFRNDELKTFESYVTNRTYPNATHLFALIIGYQFQRLRTISELIVDLLNQFTVDLELSDIFSSGK